MRKNLSAYGVLLILIGSSLADSQNLIPTVIITITGMIMAVAGIKYAET